MRTNRRIALKFASRKGPKDSIDEHPIAAICRVLGMARQMAYYPTRMHSQGRASPQASRRGGEQRHDTLRDGWLPHVKPAFYGTGTPDVYEYANANAPVPHESTVNQFFPESQFGLVASSTGAVRRRRRSSTAMRSANLVPLGKSDGKDAQFKGKRGNDEPGNPFPFVRDDRKRDEPGEEHRQIASHRMSTPRC